MELKLATRHNRIWEDADREFAVNLFRYSEPSDFPAHKHDVYTIVICLEGERRSGMNGMLESQHGGEAMVVAPGVMHSSSYPAFPQATTGVTLELSWDLFREALHSRHRDLEGHVLPQFFGAFYSPRAEDLAGRIVSRMRQHDGDDGGNLRDQVLSLAEAVGCQWPATHVSSRPQPMQSQLPRSVLLRAIEFMAICPKQRFCLSAVSRHVAMSSSRFRSLFTSSFGEAPASLYNRMLMQRASESLRTSHERIAIVAAELGFRTPSHFTEVFRRYSGLTPTEYRRRHQVAAI
jgi:AraC-like DNA-binding protein